MNKKTEGQALAPVSDGALAPAEEKISGSRPAKAKKVPAKVKKTSGKTAPKTAESPKTETQGPADSPAQENSPAPQPPAKTASKSAASAAKGKKTASARATPRKKTAPEPTEAPVTPESAQSAKPAEAAATPPKTGTRAKRPAKKAGAPAEKTSAPVAPPMAEPEAPAPDVIKEPAPQDAPSEQPAPQTARPEEKTNAGDQAETRQAARPAGSGRSRRSRARRAKKLRELATLAGQASTAQKPSPPPANKTQMAESGPAFQAFEPNAEESPANVPAFDWNEPGREDSPADALEADPAAPEARQPKDSRHSRSRGGKKHKGRQGKDADVPREDSAEPSQALAEEEEDDDFADLPAQFAESEAAGDKKSKRKMFVSVLPGEQVEVVFSEEGQVQEYYVEMLHQAKVKGNIYKGIVHNVDPNLQAAFVSYGAAKNGFLQIDEVHPEYYLAPHDAAKNRKYPLIQKVLKPGQEILVQVVKEPAGTKGAFLTSYLSMPGRFLVLTPGREQIGVSRKVESEEERARLRELLTGLTPGPGLGVIVRTVSMGVGKTNLQRDLQFLKRMWREVRKKGTTAVAPSMIYQELELAARAVRDYLTEDVQEIWVDDEEVAAQIRDIVSLLFPRRQNLVQLHKDPARTLFERFSLQNQINQIHSREVSLPSGGRLVFDHTEALTAVDINSGRSGGKNNFEDMAYRINMEAAQIIPLQLRLRDIGGQVVVDFIEMRDRSHWREVERVLRNAMKNDRARHDVGKIGPFGLLEIVRQRLGSSAISVSIEPCPCCKGTGIRRNMEWQSQQSLREIHRLLRQAQSQNQSTAVYAAGAELVLHLLNSKRERLLDMEKQFGIKLELKPA